MQRKLSGDKNNKLILSSCLSLPFCSVFVLLRSRAKCCWRERRLYWGERRFQGPRRDREVGCGHVKSECCILPRQADLVGRQREGCGLDMEGVLVCCGREVIDWGAFGFVFIWCFVAHDTTFESLNQCLLWGLLWWRVCQGVLPSYAIYFLMNSESALLIFWVSIKFFVFLHQRWLALLSRKAHFLQFRCQNTPNWGRS